MRNKVKRIIPLTPSSTEIFSFFGLGPKVVRVSHNPPKSLPGGPICRKSNDYYFSPSFCIDFILDINYKLTQHLVEMAGSDGPKGRS